MGLHKDQRNANLRHCWIAAGIVIIATMLLELGGDTVRELLAYKRDPVLAGQVWRLVTGHFVHLGWTHLLLNLAGLALVVWVVGHAFGWLRWLFVSFVVIATMDAGFWFLYPQLDWYVGLSGFMHGLLAAGLVVGIANRDRESIILTVLVLAKLLWEQTSGPLPGSESTSGGSVIVNAHLYGVAGGLLAAALSWRSVRPGAPI